MYIGFIKNTPDGRSFTDTVPVPFSLPKGYPDLPESAYWADGIGLGDRSNTFSGTSGTYNIGEFGYRLCRNQYYPDGCGLPGNRTCSMVNDTGWE